MGFFVIKKKLSKYIYAGRGQHYTGDAATTQDSTIPVMTTPTMADATRRPA